MVVTRTRPTSVFNQLFLYAQWYGDHTPISVPAGNTYTIILSRKAQPFNLSSSLSNQATKDYMESANITSTTANTQVLGGTAGGQSRIDFIWYEFPKSDVLIHGTQIANVSVACRGDGVNTTFIDSVKVSTFIKNAISGVHTHIISETYTFSPAISNINNAYSDPVTAQMYIFDSGEQEIDSNIFAGKFFIMRIEVFGHVSNAAATNNKIKLIHTRGTADTHILIGIDEILD